jgi:hypothetical protein
MNDGHRLQSALHGFLRLSRLVIIDRLYRNDSGPECRRPVTGPDEADDVYFR